MVPMWVTGRFSKVKNLLNLLERDGLFHYECDNSLVLLASKERLL